MAHQDMFKESSLVLDETYITTFKEFEKDTVYTMYFSEHLIKEEAQYKVREAQDAWNSVLLEHNVFIDNINTCEALTEKLKVAFDHIYPQEANESLLKSINRAMLTYSEDRREATKAYFSNCSVSSLKQFARYVPNFSSLYHKVYIDKDSGFFGVVLKSNKRSKPMLNLLLQDNGEVVFSFVERKKGMVKISGRAHFNNNLEDSEQIKHLLRMVKL